MSSQQQLQIGAIGIDFGSSRSVLAVAKSRGVDVIANEASLRETRNIVGYGPVQRYTGEAANAQAKSNFKNTISSFNRLLGIQSNFPKLKEETKWISSKVSQNDQGKIVHEVSYKGQNLKLLPEQVTAAMLGDLRKIISLNNIQNNEAVISVPSYYTESERKALKDACNIAGLKPLRLFNESSAIALSYGIFRKNELDPTTPRNVAFVDFGHSKFSCFIGSFTKEKLSIVSQIHERNLGARDMDWAVYQHFSKKFEAANGLSISESKKGQLRLFDAIEKMRKILSANIEADCNCEYLVEDCDLNETLSRDEFEKLCQPVLNRIKDAITFIIQEAESKKIQLHSVEVVGGAVRIPSVQAIIQQTFNVPTLHKTLNQSECIARGCALMSAMISPQFKVSQYTIEEANYYSVSVSWDYFNQNEKGERIETEGKTCVFFDKGCSIPNIKSFAQHKNDGIKASIFYTNPPEGFDPLLSTFVISPCKPKEKEFSVKIKVKLDRDGLVLLDEAQLIEDYTVEEKIPVKKDKPAPPPVAPTPAKTNEESQAAGTENQTVPPVAPVPVPEPKIEYEIQLKKKVRHSDLSLESISKLYQQPKEDIDRLTKLQSEHLSSDELIRKTHHKKNELESFIYDWRQKLSSSHQQYSTQAIAASIQQQLNDNESWLYEKGANAEFNEYSTRLEGLQSFTTPINHRFNEYTNLPQSISDLKNAIIEAENFFISNDQRFAHISKEDKKPLSDEIDRIRIWLNNSDHAQKGLSTFQDPVINCHEVHSNLGALQNVYKQVVSKPVTQPPKQEEKPAPAADSKMQTEGESANNAQAEASNMEIEK